MMMKKIANIRYLFMPFSKHLNRFALELACVILLVILPVISCYAQEALFSSYDHAAYLEYCNATAFEAKYGATECWSCDVVSILMDTMIDIVQKISPTATDLAKVILIYGAAVWLALFFLKSLSSATAQDPTQTLTALFTFMFKIALVYILVIDYGFATLIEWIVNPLLSIGIDIGTEFGNWAGGA